jgi:zinc protease
MLISRPSTNVTGGAAGGIAAATRHVLSNGMVALIQRNASNPTVSIRGEVMIGSIHESLDKAGLATFTASSLIRGTRNRTFQDIVNETEALGCSVNASAGRHGSGFSGKALIEDLPLVLEILADMVRYPTFPTEEIEKLRAIYLMHLREMEQDTHVQASRALRDLLYTAEHPYGRLSNGNIESVQALTREDMVAFHQRYHPAATRIAIVGDVEPEQVIAELERAFGDWNADGEPPVQELPTPSALSGVQRRDIPMPGKTQADILWGVHGLKRTDKDFYAAVVGNMILGRLGMGGRLGDSVREKQGLAYHASSGFQAGVGAGPWVAAAGVNPADVERAIESILREIERFKQEGPDGDELSDARAFLTGSMVIGLETNSGVAGTLLDIECFDLGLDYIERYPPMINGVTAEDIMAVARKYLSTENYVLAVAGPEAA